VSSGDIRFSFLPETAILDELLFARIPPIYQAMGLKSFIIVLVLVSATITSLFLGGYYALLPVWFLAGLFCVSAASLWATLRIETRRLLTLTATTLAMATLDEYLHVSTEIYTYFDKGVPSPVSVFGTGLLMIFILATATRLSRFFPWKNKGLLGTLPTLVSIILLLAFARVQGYLPILKWPVILLYVVMVAVGIFYAYTHPIGWTVSLIASGMTVGATMEFVGSLEGMWSFHFLEPLPLFMICIWAFRTLTVHASCFFLGVDFGLCKYSGKELG